MTWLDYGAEGHIRCGKGVHIDAEALMSVF